MTQSAAGKIVLTLHTDGEAPAAAKNTPAPAKTAASPQTKTATAKPAMAAPVGGEDASFEASGLRLQSLSPKQQAKAEPAKSGSQSPQCTAVTAKADPFSLQGCQAGREEEDKKEDKKWAMNGKRDPFFSPVVQQGGSGCSTGKKCLEIGAINLRGVVKSDTGFIAVVTNNLNKAYFLRENDPVFNGYVVKITGDSVVFQETIQDKLGKPFTREVVKRIFTPAV